MEWSLSWSKYAANIAASARAAGHPVPRSAIQPKLLPGAEFFWSAFVKLNTCRYYESGFIPYTEVESFAERHLLDVAETEELFYFVQKLDAKYFELMEKKRKKK